MYGFSGIPSEFLAGGVSNLDSDAMAFLRAAQIIDPRITYAVNRLVIDLKRLGVWDKIHCLYPFVGASAAPHRLNLKAPASNLLTYFSTPIHNTGGFTPIGGSASTNFLASSLDPVSYAIGYYSRTPHNIGAGAFMGAATGVGGLPGISIAYTSTNLQGVGTNQTVSRVSGINDSVGFQIMSRSAADSLRLYRNGNVIATNNTIPSGALPANAITVGTQSGLLPIRSSSGLAFISRGLTDSEVWGLTQAVQIFQNAMQRAV